MNQRNSKIDADTLVIDFLDSKKLVFILLIAVLLYSFSDKSIINLPDWIFAVRFMISILLITALFIWRYTQYQAYYKKLLEEKLNVFAVIFVILFLSTFLQLLINVPLDLYLVQNAKNNNTEYYDCEIHDVQTSNKYGDKIRFIFLGEINSKNISTQNHEPKDLMVNYVVTISVKKSLFGSFYLEHAKLKRKS